MVDVRKVTKFHVCDHHRGTLAGLGRKRKAEFFCEGGPVYGGSCAAGDPCRIMPGADLFDETLCRASFTTLPGSLFAWAVNAER